MTSLNPLSAQAQIPLNPTLQNQKMSLRVLAVIAVQMPPILSRPIILITPTTLTIPLAILRAVITLALAQQTNPRRTNILRRTRMTALTVFRGLRHSIPLLYRPNPSDGENHLDAHNEQHGSNNQCCRHHRAPRQPGMTTQDFRKTRSVRVRASPVA